MRFGFHFGVNDAPESLFGDVARFPWGWGHIESTPSSYDFRGARAIYDRLAARGVRQIVTLDTPALRPGFDFARFVYAVAREFPNAVALEILNEPNLNAKFGAEQYAAIFRGAYDAARSTGYTGPIIAAGPARVGSWEDYLRAMFRAGIPDGADLALHPYPPQDTRDAVRAMKRQLAFGREVLRNRSGHERLWATEFGISTGSVGERAQARKLVKLVRACRDEELEGAIIFRLSDPRAPINPWENGLGVLRADGSPKLAYEALRPNASV